ncbi:MAG: UbiD family decarboxylase [Rhodospirillales bacterium]|nr:UbiD family decarboxylase [Rhodospirillales bacterium]
MSKDLRSFLGEARQMGSDYFVSVSRPVDPLFEPCVIQQKLQAAGKFPVIRCENMNGSELPLVTNLLGSYSLLGLALGVDPDESKSNILKRFRERGANPLPTKTVARDEAPVKQIVMTGDDIDLSKLPIIHHAEEDSGKYITVGTLVVRDPDTGVINAGIYRHEIQGKDKIGCMFNPAHHAGYIYRRHRELKKPMEAILFLGHHPAAVMGSQLRGSIDGDEYEFMGGLMDEPLEVIKGETVDLPVPAYAEIVIEGILDPNNETDDGPFAEYTGFYGPAKDPIGLMQITAITMRSDAIYHDLDPAHPEHNLAGVLTFESVVFDSVKQLVPSVTAVHLPASGVYTFTAFIQIKKGFPGEGMSAGLAAIAATSEIKIAVVVNEDIDIYNEEEVWWAVATHFEADTGLAIIPNAVGSHLNPSAYGEVRTEKGPMNSKMIIDATRPATLPFATRIRPHKETWDRIRLEDYIDG